MTCKKRLLLMKKELLQIKKLMDKDKWGFWSNNFNNWGNAVSYIFYTKDGYEYEINDDTEEFPNCSINDIIYICKRLKNMPNTYYDIYKGQFTLQDLKLYLMPLRNKYRINYVVINNVTYRYDNNVILPI